MTAHYVGAELCTAGIALAILNFVNAKDLDDALPGIIGAITAIAIAVGVYLWM